MITSGALTINPPQKRNEVLALLDKGLEDFSVSRPAIRAGGWGVPVPSDPSQVIYVWWDALTNYITALGVDRHGKDYEFWWAGDGERVHVIGKGITRFHAVYWIGLLLSAGQPLPTTIHVHDYVNLANQLLNTAEPWNALKHPDGDPHRIHHLLSRVVHACRTITRELAPFCPAGATRLASQLGDSDRVAAPEPAFVRLA